MNEYIYNIIFINDGSIDRTFQEINELKNVNSFDNVEITVIDKKKNEGHELTMFL